MTAAGPFAWRYVDENGREIGVSARFEAQESAEAWLGESWAGLAADGVEEVELVEEGDEGGVVYRMSLRDQSPNA